MKRMMLVSSCLCVFAACLQPVEEGKCAVPVDKVCGTRGNAKDPQSGYMNLFPLRPETTGCTMFLGLVVMSPNTDPGLQSLRGLRDADDIMITGGLDAPTIAGLDDLRSVQRLVIDDNHGLSDISALHSLVRAGDVVISMNPDLKNLHGLEGLWEVHDLKISANDNLENLDGLANLVHVRGDLTFKENPRANAAFQQLLSHVFVNGEIKVQ